MQLMCHLHLFSCKQSIENTKTDGQRQLSKIMILIHDKMFGRINSEITTFNLFCPPRGQKAGLPREYFLYTTALADTSGVSTNMSAFLIFDSYLILGHH